MSKKSHSILSGYKGRKRYHRARAYACKFVLENSFLNDVYLRRKGIPISLSLVFMGLARYVGLKTVGISFPGHFLVKMSPNCEDEEFLDSQNQFFVDTFEGGRLLSVDDCKQRLEEWTRGLVPFGPEVLRVAHPRDIISRMLRNLRAIYAEKEDLPRLYWVLSALIETCPSEKVESLKERGFLMARMGRYTPAVEDLRAHLALTTDPRKYEQVEKILRYFEIQKEQMN
jgi:regulator of sirC expression with transglutaminase-like and TPR domain